MTNTPLEENDSPRVFRMVNVEVICGTLYPLLKEKNSVNRNLNPVSASDVPLTVHGASSVQLSTHKPLTGYLHLGLLVSMGNLLNLVN